MFNKKYKKGMKDAAKAYEAFGEKQEKALEVILEELRSGNIDIKTAIDNLDGNINSLYEYLNSQELAKLYTVYTPFDIKHLKDNEKLFLGGALLKLTMDRTPTDAQQIYLNAVLKYLSLKEPPFGVDLFAIENIEEINAQKAIYQTVLEYLILQDGNHYDETEVQQDFLDSFCLNLRSRETIAKHVEILYSSIGSTGLSEKYNVADPEIAIKERVAEEREKLLDAVNKLDNIILSVSIYGDYNLYDEDFDVINEEYPTKGSCQKAIENELRKKYNSVSEVFNSYSSNSIDKRIFIEIKKEVECFFEEIRHYSQKLENIIKKDSFYEITDLLEFELYKDSIQEALKENLSESICSSPSFVHYSQMLEYECFSFDEGLLASLTAKWSCENFYDIDIYADAQASADVFAKYANSIVCEKIVIPIKNKVEEIVLKVFPDIDVCKTT